MTERGEWTWRDHAAVAIASIIVSHWIIGQAALLALALDQWP